MKKILGIAAVIAAILMLSIVSSCTTFQAEGLTFTTFNSDVEVLGTFSKSKTVHELFGSSGGTNLFNITSTAMSDKVSGIIWQEIQKKGGNAARNITIKYYVGPFAYLANIITGKIWAPARLKITGEVIRTSSRTAQLETDHSIEVALAELN